MIAILFNIRDSKVRVKLWPLQSAVV